MVQTRSQQKTAAKERVVKAKRNLSKQRSDVKQVDSKISAQKKKRSDGKRQKKKAAKLPSGDLKTLRRKQASKKVKKASKKIASLKKERTVQKSQVTGAKDRLKKAKRSLHKLLAAKSSSKVECGKVWRSSMSKSHKKRLPKTVKQMQRILKRKGYTGVSGLTRAQLCHVFGAKPSLLR